MSSQAELSQFCKSVYRNRELNFPLCSSCPQALQQNSPKLGLALFERQNLRNSVLP